MFFHGIEIKGVSSLVFVAPDVPDAPEITSYLYFPNNLPTSVSPMAKALRTFIITMKNRNMKVRRMSLARTSSAL